MTIALETVLAKAGLRVEAAQFEILLVDAAKKLTPPHPDPTLYFTPEQRAALTETGLDLRASEDTDVDPRARSVAAHTVLRDGALSVTDSAARIGVDGSRIRHRLMDGMLAGWKNGGAWRLPAWQFTERGVLPGLEVVLPAIPPDQPPLAVATFMSTSQPDLLIENEQSTPRAWLLAGGDPNRVAELAATLGTAI